MMNRRFLSTLSLRRATTQTQKHLISQTISIHALLAESDGILLTLTIGFSEFLSTLSLRRATHPSAMSSSGKAYFYPRSPCGERHDTSSLMKCQAKFLSTLSLRRATRAPIPLLPFRWYFYPRSPCGERPHPADVYEGTPLISIHALLAESDTQAADK